MTLDDIHKEWESDSRLDKSNLDTSSLVTNQLHSKYWKILTKERLTLAKLLSEFSKLKVAKLEFYHQGPSKETQALGWKAPDNKVLVKDIPLYMEGDVQLIEQSLKLAIVKEKINLVEDIIKSIHSRGFVIRNALEDIKLKLGG